MNMHMMAILVLALIFGVFSTNTMAVEVGDKAPDFTAQSTTGKISLSNYRGEKNVVLALYYAIDTPV